MLTDNSLYWDIFNSESNTDEHIILFAIRKNFLNEDQIVFLDGFSKNKHSEYFEDLDGINTDIYSAINQENKNYPPGIYKGTFKIVNYKSHEGYYDFDLILKDDKNLTLILDTKDIISYKNILIDNIMKFVRQQKHLQIYGTKNQQYHNRKLYNKNNHIANYFKTSDLLTIANNWIEEFKPTPGFAANWEVTDPNISAFPEMENFFLNQGFNLGEIIILHHI